MLFKYNIFGYDKEGFNRDGFNKQGFDREGFDKAGIDAAGYNREGYNQEGYNRAGFNRSGYNKAGFDKDGFNLVGLDRDGFNRDGFDSSGFDRNGWDCDGFDHDGFDSNGFNRNGWDRNGWDRDGFDHDGFDSNGFNHNGWDRDGFDHDGFDSNGFNRNGWDRNGFYRDGFDYDGFNREGWDRDGYNRDGFDSNGFNRNGWDRDGFDREGFGLDRFNREGFDREGFDREGYGPDGFTCDGYDRNGYNRQGFDRDGYGRNGIDLFGHTKDGKILCPECYFTFPNKQVFCPNCGCPISYINRHYELHQVDTNTIVHTFMQGPEIDDVPVERMSIETTSKVCDLNSDIDVCSSLYSLISGYDSVVIFDVETTGLDFDVDNIIELAYLKLAIDGSSIKFIKKRDVLIQLEPSMRPLSPQITAITHITKDMLELGITRKEFLTEVKDMLSEAQILLMAYNANFDLNFLANFLEGKGQKYLLDGVDFLDLLTVYKDRRPYPHKLKDAILAYGCESEVANTHRAIDDVKASLRVLEKMSEERNDIKKYINLFGYNPKYSINGQAFKTVRYVPQPYHSIRCIYEY